jgi:hypothetical protein
LPVLHRRHETWDELGELLGEPLGDDDGATLGEPLGVALGAALGEELGVEATGQEEPGLLQETR